MARADQVGDVNCRCWLESSGAKSLRKPFANRYSVIPSTEGVLRCIGDLGCLSHWLRSHFRVFSVRLQTSKIQSQRDCEAKLVLVS